MPCNRHYANKWLLSEATAMGKKAEKWGGNVNDPGRLAQPSRPTSVAGSPVDTPPPSVGPSKAPGSADTSVVPKLRQRPKVATIPAYIFAENTPPSTTKHKLPEPDQRLDNTPQLVCCLGLLKIAHSLDDIPEQAAQKWLQIVEKDSEEQEREEVKDAKAVAEVVWLAPMLNNEIFHNLLGPFYSAVDHAGLLDFQSLEGLAQMIQGAGPGYLSGQDLDMILKLLSERLRNTKQQKSGQHLYRLTLAVSNVLDAMAEAISQVSTARPSTNHSRRTSKAWSYETNMQGRQGSPVKGLDLEKLVEGPSCIQQGMDGLSKAVEVAKTAYEGVTSLMEGGQGLYNSLKEGLSFEQKRPWYAALRRADLLIQDGELGSFRKPVCEVPCRYDLPFQLGITKRLGQIAGNSKWDAVVRRSAIAFLGEIYRDDEMWGAEPKVKQWILNILMQLASTGTSGSSGTSGTTSPLHVTVARILLLGLETCDPLKRNYIGNAARKDQSTTH
ncbi:hypothetical protein BGX31_007004 [Mortierella sp. GBA43]|nr:hypothetical protein BGX31_007004 [Mortierella sp. GBA43]